MNKTVLHYIILLLFLVLGVGVLLAGNNDTSSMSMPQMISVSIILVVYIVGMSLVGEGTHTDEREKQHRYLSNRAGLVIGSIILSAGVLYQIFISHDLDYWLLAGLAGINVTKIITLIWAGRWR